LHCVLRAASRADANSRRRAIVPSYRRAP
jgi:hypothetical protein